MLNHWWGLLAMSLSFFKFKDRFMSSNVDHRWLYFSIFYVNLVQWIFTYVKSLIYLLILLSWEHLTEHNNDQINWQKVGRFDSFLIEARLYFVLCGKPQLVVLMHSWWLMTGVLSDHGILMATYPRLSKEESTKSCWELLKQLSVYQMCRFLLTASLFLPGFFLTLFSSSEGATFSFNYAEHLCHCSLAPSVILISKPFQQACHSFFLELSTWRKQM